VNSYRVCFEHKAGHLVTKVVEAQSKAMAEALIRDTFPIVFNRISSITLLRPMVRS